MKGIGGGTSAPSAGVNSLPIAERQKPAPSCVASLFQMLAKRKLFSSTSTKSKLLPPGRAHKFSPGRPPGGGGGGDASPAAKRKPLLLDSADCSRSKGESRPTDVFLPPPDQEQNCSERRTPGVVARLMGLSSMPGDSHQTPTKATEPYKLGDHRNADSQDWSGTSRSIYTSPQKQQKTERRADDRRHGDGSQFSAPDARPSWPRRRHANKMASPVKSPRTMSSRNKARLIEAAAKVLEPGLQSRSSRLSRRHAYLEYSCNGGDEMSGAATVLHSFSGQFSAGMSDADAPKLGAHGIGATSLHKSTSNQWIEEVERCSVPVKRSDQNLSCQMQPERNGKCPFVSLSEKPVFGGSVINQDIRKNQLKNMSPRIVSGGPLKQNYQKQNTLPAPCRAAEPGYPIQRHKHRSREQNAANSVQDFVSLNKRTTSSTSLRSKRKIMDKFIESDNTAENKVLSTKACQTSSHHCDRHNKLKPKTATQRALEKDMIITKGAGLVSEKRKSASPNCARSDLQRHALSKDVSKCNKKSDIISFTLSSSRKVFPTSPVDKALRTGSAVKRHSRRESQSTRLPSMLDFREVEGASSRETAESVFISQDKLKNRSIDGRAASSLFKNKCVVPVTVEPLGDEQQWQCIVDSASLCLSKPEVQLHDTQKTDAKGRLPSPSITRGSNKRSPTSNLQSTYAEDTFVAGIVINTVAAGALTDSHPVDTCTPATGTRNVTTEGKFSCAEPNSGLHGAQPFEPAVQDSKLTQPEAITSTVELLLSIVRCQTKKSSKTFLLQTIESALATMAPSSSKSKQGFSSIKAAEAANPLRELAIDFVLELLDLMCVDLCDSGYSSFSKLALVCREERLAAEISKEVVKCSGMAGRALDDLAVSDVERTVEAGMSSVLEALQVAGQIEQDLVQEVVNEIGVDVFKRL